MSQTSHYLWCDVTIQAAPDDPLNVLQHSLSCALPAEQTLRMQTIGASALDCQRGSHREQHSFANPLERATWAYRQVHDRMSQQARSLGWHRLHTAMLQIGQHLTLIAGASGKGKTTLTYQLGQSGHPVYSDEAVYLHGAKVIALPRRMHIKASSIHHIDPAIIDKALRMGFDPPIWALDPAAFAPTPAVPPRRPDRLILLGERDAQHTALYSAHDAEAVAALMSESAPYSADLADLALAITELLGQVPVFRLDGYSGTRGAERLSQ